MQCYNCDAILQGTETHCPMCGIGLVKCSNPQCGCLISSEYLVCPFCNEDVQPSSLPAGFEQTPFSDVPPQPLDWMTSLPTSCMALDLDSGPSSSFNLCHLCFKQGKTCKVAEQTYLEFQLTAGSVAIYQVDLSVQGADDWKAKSTLRELSAGSTEDFDGIAFVPKRAGEGFFKVSLTVFLKNGVLYCCTGRTTIRIEDKEQHIHIWAGRDVIGVNAGAGLILPSMNLIHWKPVPLKPDKDTLRRIARLLVPPIDQVSDFDRFPRQPGEGESPGSRFILADQHSGWRLFVFSGSKISIGRNTKQMDWAVRFLDEFTDKQPSLQQVSRHHCDINVGERIVTIIDRSSSGTSINDVCIPKNKEIMLADEDIVSLAGVFQFRVRVKSDERGIAAIVLTRCDDGMNRHRYAVLRRWLDLRDTGARVDGWVLRENEKIYFSMKPDGASELNGQPLPQGKNFE